MEGTSERTVDGEALQVDPLPEDPADGSTVLVATAGEPTRSAVGLRILCTHGTDDDTALVVTTTESADRTIAVHDGIEAGPAGAGAWPVDGRTHQWGRAVGSSAVGLTPVSSCTHRPGISARLRPPRGQHPGLSTHIRDTGQLQGSSSLGIHEPAPSILVRYGSSPRAYRPFFGGHRRHGIRVLAATTNPSSRTRRPLLTTIPLWAWGFTRATTTERAPSRRTLTSPPSASGSPRSRAMPTRSGRDAPSSRRGYRPQQPSNPVLAAREQGRAGPDERGRGIEPAFGRGRNRFLERFGGHLGAAGRHPTRPGRLPRREGSGRRLSGLRVQEPGRRPRRRRAHCDDLPGVRVDDPDRGPAVTASTGRETLSRRPRRRMVPGPQPPPTIEQTGTADP